MVNLLPLGITDMTIIFLIHCNFIVEKSYVVAFAMPDRMYYAMLHLIIL